MWVAMALAIGLSGCGNEPSAPQAVQAPASASASASAAPSAPVVADVPDYALEMAAYRDYVGIQVEQLQVDVAAFTAAVESGDLDAAARLYAPSRQGWERIEPVAELFPDLDRRMDARADDFKLAEADPEFAGWHRLEHALFTVKSLEGMAPVAAQLRADAATLQERLATLELVPGVVVGGAAELIEEVAASKISGEENRYSGTDLWDFKANVDGSRTIVDLFRSRIGAANPELVVEIDESFALVDALLARYRLDDGWANYAALTDADRNDMRGAINGLAEQLALLRGTLQLD